MTREGISLDRVEKLPTLQGPTLGYRRGGGPLGACKRSCIDWFREKGSKFIADIDGCPVLDQRIGQSLGLLESTIASLSQPDRIPQVEVAAGDDTLAIVIRHLEALCEADLTPYRRLVSRPDGTSICNPRALTQFLDSGPPRGQNDLHTALVSTVLSINLR